MREIILRILEAGCLAPSGGNSQPWRFEAIDNTINVIAEPEKDHRVLNFRNRGTWVAHGALLENIVVAALHHGYNPTITTFPDPTRPNLTARVILEKCETQVSPLYDAIFERTTNRKPYDTTPLSTATSDSLISCTEGLRGEVRLFDERSAIESLAQASSINEVIMFGNKSLHKLFFDELVWTEQQESDRKSGLYLKTMELQPPQQKALQLLKHWGAMRFVNLLGFNNMIAKDNAAVYATASAIGAILVANNDESFIDAGRLMERLWLTSTASGLSFHLMTGVLFMHQSIAAGEIEVLSLKESELIERAYKQIAELVKPQDLAIAMLFRIGKDGKPSARSSKKKPVLSFLG